MPPKTRAQLGVCVCVCGGGVLRGEGISIGMDLWSGDGGVC